MELAILKSNEVWITHYNVFYFYLDFNINCMNCKIVNQNQMTSKYVK